MPRSLAERPLLASPFDSLGAALADRYTFERELGRGGMAMVYLAQDLKHHRPVALKVLRPELAHALGPERFLREITVTAGLHHPHILTLLDSGEAQGFLYYVMPYVEGESLRDRLNRERQLPLEDALQITREVADALSYAHSRDVVHRDIKPENILLESGHALVADFGIARAITAAGSAKLTETGIVVGTPAYMSPEQASGTQHLDGRSDLYSLGCVLYEMLAGHPPFTGTTAQEVLARHSMDAVPRLSAARPAVPLGVERAVNTALAKVPADRWPTGSAFAEALESAAARMSAAGVARAGKRRTLVRISMALSAALLLAAVTWIARARPGVLGGSAGDSLRSVAVLPFRNLGDSAQAYVADGLTEAVINSLVRVAGLRVPASSRVFPYRGRIRDVRDVGRELAVDKIVTGSVQVAGARLRVTAQLVNVDDGISIWSDQYPGDLADIFAVQDSIATRIVEALRIRLAGSTVAVGRGVRTRDPMAYDLYLQAQRAMYELTLPGIEKAIALLQQALRRDSTFADAWAALAGAYGGYAQFGGLPPAEVTSRIRTAAERAIELDSLNGAAYVRRAELRGQVDWDWDGALRDMRRALDLSPASADVESGYGAFLNAVAEPESALTHAREAVVLDPTNSFLVAGVGFRFRFLGMDDSAIVYGERALVMDSTQWVASITLMEPYEHTGRQADGEREAARVLRYAGDSLPVALHWLAHYYALAGQPERAREMLRRLTALARRQYVPACYLGVALLAVGDRAGALDAVEQSARNRDMDLPWDLMGLFEALDGERRYEAVRRRVFGNRPAPRRW